MTIIEINLSICLALGLVIINHKITTMETVVGRWLFHSNYSNNSDNQHYLYLYFTLLVIGVIYYMYIFIFSKTRRIFKILCNMY